ncbi:glycosyltransferase family 71 protein [Zopfia rhizophila CBS 207.26]|uniref:Glycosyltransferase family 71 protein n=1 Tax=Zopfia rhizophila CBS 207.26 TaxID=1314779 RepID=A0A6A6EQT2_9PEZI|nr:glycosyltransferase family 71 protein [Zopfia rhizophila CBS 207.26]
MSSDEHRTSRAALHSHRPRLPLHAASRRPHPPCWILPRGWDEYNATVSKEVLPSLNARCRVLSDIYFQGPNTALPKSYQFKVFTILFSGFEDVMFPDADAFPAHNPDELFISEPYTTHGLVTWSDPFANTASSHYFHIAGLPPVPVGTRYSTEFGQLLLNKAKHAASLVLMVYYNYCSPSYYYPLLCQRSHGAGDEETFIHAAMAIDTPFYQVKTGVSSLGH